MGRSNLPPGCNSADGGIDQAFETALEGLCEQIDSVELIEDVLALLPALKARRQAHYQHLSANTKTNCADPQQEVDDEPVRYQIHQMAKATVQTTVSHSRQGAWCRVSRYGAGK